MVKVLDGVENIGEELKCDYCNSVIHFEEEDLIEVKYIICGKDRYNQAVNCPKCECFVYRWKDR